MKRHGFLRIVASLSVLLCVGFSANGNEWEWKSIAFGDLLLRSVASPPDSGDVLYVAMPSAAAPDSETGVYKSRDGGISWEYLSESNNVHCYRLTVDERDQSAVYCGTGTTLWHPEGWAWRSRDAGSHWDRGDFTHTRYLPSPWGDSRIFATHTYDPVDLGFGLARSQDDGVSWILVCNDFAWSLSDHVVFHSQDSSVVCAAICSPISSSPGLGRSDDGGVTWRVILPGYVRGFDQDPADPLHWMAVMGHGEEYSEDLDVASSLDDGATWSTWPIGTYGNGECRLEFDHHEPGTIYLRTDRLYRSDDEGVSWALLSDGLPGTGATLDFCQTSRPGELLAARSDGLWLWTDRVSAEESPLLGVAGALKIEAVAPVPFRDIVTARFTCDAPEMVSAGIYSLEGRLVRTLMDGTIGAERHQVSWDGRTAQGSLASPGAYVLRVVSPSGQATATVVRVR
ncbi:hypothetical protein JXA88_12805 [Candidatus Fermentibacteria bacterium]|nr:hypothetical protein [Candidatus Fermentibacteria bacterium]